MRRCLQAYRKYAGDIDISNGEDGGKGAIANVRVLVSEHEEDFISDCYFEGPRLTSATLKQELEKMVGDTKSLDEEASADDMPRLFWMNSKWPFDDRLAEVLRKLHQ